MRFAGEILLGWVCAKGDGSCGGGRGEWGAIGEGGSGIWVFGCAGMVRAATKELGAV